MGYIYAVDGVSFKLDKGKVLGIVGESGCGKSTLALSILKLLPKSAKIISGKILYKEKNLLENDINELRKIRGSRISMIYQNPQTSLNPVLKIGEQIAEIFEVHNNLKKDEALKKACQLINLVEIPDAKARMKSYPHELSGGMLQRILIAMAIACDPELIIADEPTSALDATIQIQILELIKRMIKKFNLSIIFVSHNFGVISDICDEIAVMYAGHIVEIGDISTIIGSPVHPYTKGLLESLLFFADFGKRLKPIKGTPPNLLKPPIGCRFHFRCPFVMPICKLEEPTLKQKSGRFVKCFL